VPVHGEGHVALDNASALPRSGLVRFLRVLWELQRGAAMADREIGLAERPVFALHQLVLQPARVHAVDQIEWPWAELYAQDFRLGRQVSGNTWVS
jgi:hypothetical protein